MTFAYTVTHSGVFGSRKVAWGTYTSSGGGTGGDVITGFSTVEEFQLQPKGTAVVANAPAVNETLPLSSENVTIVTAADEVGTWFAIGK